MLISIYGPSLESWDVALNPFSSLCRTPSCISPIPSLVAVLTSCQETNATSHLVKVPRLLLKSLPKQHSNSPDRLLWIQPGRQERATEINRQVRPCLDTLQQQLICRSLSPCTTDLIPTMRYHFHFFLSEFLSSRMCFHFINGYQTSFSMKFSSPGLLPENPKYQQPRAEMLSYEGGDAGRQREMIQPIGIFSRPGVLTTSPPIPILGDMVWTQLFSPQLINGIRACTPRLLGFGGFNSAFPSSSTQSANLCRHNPTTPLLKWVFKKHLLRGRRVL